MQCFFFSSRRRHTRWPRDWSSDVCSSDLKKSTSSESSRSAEASGSRAANGEQRRTGPKSNRTSTNGAPAQAEIGRASCRERVEIGGGAGAVLGERQNERDASGEGLRETDW